ncbi:MAG: retroviral-like aspartic protease family protein [Acidobacteriota bacterium]
MRLRGASAAAALALVSCVSVWGSLDPTAHLIARQDVPARADNEIQLQLGNLLLRDGRYEDAVEAFRHARSRAPGVVATKAGVGLVTSLLRLGEFGAAFAEADGTLKSAPRSAEALATYADALWALGRFEESARAAKDALSLDPTLAQARHGLARVFAGRSRLDDALVEAQAALRSAPASGEYQYTLGSIYQRMKAFDAAAGAFENYVNLLPNRDKSDKNAWARAQVRFLRAFDGIRPLELSSDVAAKAQIVPFRLVRDKVVVKARVNGSDYTDFVLDTGAEMTIVSQQLAVRMGVRPVTYVRSAGVGEVGLRGLQVGIIDKLQIGTLTISNVPCLIKNPPLHGLPTRETEAFSPLVLGLSMTIDYRLRLLTFGESLPRQANTHDLPLWLHRLAMVQGLVNGAHPVNFVVDTGGEVISISQSTAGAIDPLPAGRRIALKVYGTSGWDPDAFLMPNVDLSFEQVVMPKTAVVVLNLEAPSALLGFQLGGIVGHQFLSKYTVTVDLQRSVLALGD